MNIKESVLVSKTKQKGKNEYVQRDFLDEYIIKNNDDDWVIDTSSVQYFGIPTITGIC